MRLLQTTSFQNTLQALLLAGVLLATATPSRAQTISAQGEYYIGDPQSVTAENIADSDVCTQWYYIFDETKCTLGNSVCQTACQCDGRRLCIDGCCSGWPRTVQNLGYIGVSIVQYEHCLTPTYYFNEESMSSTCQSPCECDGNRFCAQSGECIGMARSQNLCATASVAALGEALAESSATSAVSGQACVEALSTLFALAPAEVPATNKWDLCYALSNFTLSEEFKSECAKSVFCARMKDAVLSAMSWQEDLPDDTTTVSPAFALCIQVINYMQDHIAVREMDLVRALSEGRQEYAQNVTAAQSKSCATAVCASPQSFDCETDAPARQEDDDDSTVHKAPYFQGCCTAHASNLQYAKSAVAGLSLVLFLILILAG